MVKFVIKCSCSTFNALIKKVKNCWSTGKVKQVSITTITLILSNAGKTRTEQYQRKSWAGYNK